MFFILQCGHSINGLFFNAPTTPPSRYNSPLQYIKLCTSPILFISQFGKPFLTKWSFDFWSICYYFLYFFSLFILSIQNFAICTDKNLLTI